LILLFGALLLPAQNRSPLSGGHPQTQSTNVVADAIPAELRASMPAAITRNVESRLGLEWSLSGRNQRGWVIYESLIRRAIGVDEGTSDSAFAVAVARWQKERGLRQTAVLDKETWYAMIGEFQANRLKDRRYPSSEQLMVVPARESYDPERAEELRQVEKSTYAAYKRMIAAALKDKTLKLNKTSAGELDPDEKFLKIFSAFRSREYQDKLRRAEPNAGPNALAKNSPHFTGRALDLYVGGEPANSSDANRLIQSQTRVYKWLVRNAGAFGFRPYFYEPWHWEYVPNTN
jgi:LAS superfamily LD-carboxypeptidase LdcB